MVPQNLRGPMDNWIRTFAAFGDGPLKAARVVGQVCDLLVVAPARSTVLISCTCYQFVTAVTLSGDLNHRILGHTSLRIVTNLPITRSRWKHYKFTLRSDEDAAVSLAFT